MELAILRVNLYSSLKDILIVGEIHIYGDKEFRWANELLKNKKIDYAFSEGGLEVGGFLSHLYTMFFRLAQLITWRNKKTLRELAIEKGIPLKLLEEGTVLPMRTKVGLSILILFFFLVVVRLIVSLFQDWRLTLALLSIFILTFSIGMRILNYSKWARYLPVNKENRDKIMSSNLIKYVKELDFKTGLVIVGKAHFPQMVAAVRDNFESQLIEANSQF